MRGRTNGSSIVCSEFPCVAGGTTETIGSYDLEYVIDEHRKKIFHSDSPIYCPVVKNEAL